MTGFLGPYGAQSGIWSWYDQAAHPISASFVAGVGYAVIAVLDHGSTRIHFPEEFRFVFTLSFILAFRVAWEIAEFATGGLTATILGEEVLVQYGTDDIVFDLLFNTLAGALVARWGTAHFRNTTAAVSRFLPRTGWP